MRKEKGRNEKGREGGREGSEGIGATWKEGCFLLQSGMDAIAESSGKPKSGS